MKIRSLVYPKHLVLICNEEDTVIRLKLSPSDVALLHAEFEVCLAYFGEVKRPKPQIRPSGDYLEVVEPQSSHLDPKD